ncbi:pheromone A receptor-domain-containing protein [Mycena galopus ATCC 62051]|nr:pheromone A receptor-domain-containing protein [Mycena galopus ATCC 62051]
MSAALAASAYVASVLALVPLPWHWRSRNVATLSIIAWLFVLNLSYAINAVIWAGNVDIVLPVWCDIVTKIKIGATFALPSSCLCLALQLHAIASSLKTPTRGRKGVAVDITLCYGLPVLIMALHYIVQGHRFDIVEDLGCRPAIYISVLSLLLVDLPPAVASFLALVYCGLALFHFFRRRIAFTRLMNSTKSGLTTSRYTRLMAMTTVLGTWNAVIIGIGLWATYSPGFRPWTSWSDIHFGFSRIQPYLLSDFPNALLLITYLLWAAVPISSFFFFAFFSFGDDAMKEYKYLIQWIRRTVFRQEPKFPDPDHTTTSVYAPSLGTVSDGRIISLGDGSSFTPPRSPYTYAPRHDSASSTTFTSTRNLLPSDAAVEKQPDFHHERDFWAI